RGAFTGADQAKPGFFEIANGGTIFLDEIGDVSTTFQLKLLRVLQQGEYNRVGDTRVYRTDVRVLAATNQNLSDAVRAGRFRADLYYRLNVVHLHLPPLRERKDDIPALAHFFLQKCSQRLNRPAPRLSPQALQLLERHDWPGNVRELQNVIERAVIMCDDGEVRPEHLPDELRPSPESPQEPSSWKPDFNVPFKVAKERFLGDFERQYILHHLSLNRGNVARTARSTGMFEGHLYQKMKRYHINPDQFRPPRANAHRAAKLA
ncbi:MAG: sigma-54-dependent Fis family transcriptional regulator, partial [Acidobacteria bacterium]